MGADGAVAGGAGRGGAGWAPCAGACAGRCGGDGWTGRAAGAIVGGCLIVGGAPGGKRGGSAGLIGFA
jgi:hypothetical protein